MKYWFLTIACFCAFPVNAENLLSNPGFDRLTLEGTPAHWDLFILPDNQALGRADSVLHDGYYSAMLHTPIPYAKDPINNWSQVVYDNLIGIPLVLSGSIRSDQVGEAALWIQCFSKTRSRILATASSSDSFMVSGTRGWTKVSAAITPPPHTDFIVVRCIIKGKGQAWFDSLSLSIKPPEALEPPLEDLGAPEALVPEKEIAAPMEEFVALRDSMEATIAALEKSNRDLTQKTLELQQDLDRYRNEIREQARLKSRPRGAHPLVPDEYRLKGDSRDE